MTYEERLKQRRLDVEANRLKGLEPKLSSTEKLLRNNTSGCTGVSFHKANNNWRTYIHIDGKHLPISSHTDWFEAVCARKSAEAKYKFVPKPRELNLVRKPRQKRIQKNMDAKKWKSIIVDRKTYDELCIIKEVEGRTLSGQLRLIFQDWKMHNLSTKDVGFINDKVMEMRAEQGGEKYPEPSENALIRP